MIFILNSFFDQINILLSFEIKGIKEDNFQTSQQANKQNLNFGRLKMVNFLKFIFLIRWDHLTIYHIYDRLRKF